MNNQIWKALNVVYTDLVGRRDLFGDPAYYDMMDRVSMPVHERLWVIEMDVSLAIDYLVKRIDFDL